MCSKPGEAIERIAAAIDQLASDAREGQDEPGSIELTARVATLWEMISALDPELARRARGYTTPPDGTLSS